MKMLLPVVSVVVGLASTAAAQPAPPPAPPPAPRAIAPVPAKPTPPPMPVPKPADELVAYGALVAGTWHCKGTVMEPDGSSHPMLGTDKITPELDKFWVHSSFSAPQGKWTFRYDSWTTFDATAKLWKRTMFTNDGGSMQGTAKPDPAKLDWDLTVDNARGQSLFREHTDLSDLKTGLKSWGEVSMDKGKTWIKVFEQTCKK